MKNTIYTLIPALIGTEKIEATFVKANGEIRVIKCLFESTRYITKGILTVFDIEKQGYRSINLATLKSICLEDEIYSVNEDSSLTYDGDRRVKMLDLLTYILGEEVFESISSLKYEWLCDLYELVEDINTTELEAVKAMFEYFSEHRYFDFYEIEDVISGKYEFIPNVSLETLAHGQLFGAYIPLPNWNISYGDYLYREDDLRGYYYEASHGVIQIRNI